jgi:hypothetical protein
LYRQSRILARSGVDIHRSTLADWFGVTAFHLGPVVDRLAEHLKASTKLFMDETTAPVLDRGRGPAISGRWPVTTAVGAARIGAPPGSSWSACLTPFGEDDVAEDRFAGHRLIVAHDPVRAAEQGDRRCAWIAELDAMAEKMVGKLDAKDAGQTAKGRRASDRRAYSRFARAVAEAELTRFLNADLHADRFSWSVDEDAIGEAELFDGKPALITNAPDLTPTDAVAHYKGLADIERGFRVLKSDIEIAPVHHRLPDRISAHAMICFLALVLYRVMRMRLKAKGQSASPRTALSLLARIQKHTAHAGKRSFHGLSKTTREQLDLFDALNLPKPA